MSKILWAGMAGFLCGIKYKEMGRPLCWKKMQRKAMKMMKKL